ncbi:MAG: hypothetical protein M1821_001704 [Bathelium mastoideum]|nr:MAG: hypothetical protein M1821_001704 [Bathelium mastoideum]
MPIKRKCWDKQPLHIRKALGSRGEPHEKTQVSVAATVRKVLVPSADFAERQKLHEDDEATTWFGIERPDAGRPLFQDFGRFGDLIDHTNQGRQATWQPPGNSPLEDTDTRTPCLVSFVGETGAGKSALIKLLIDLNLGESGGFYSTPVVGSASATDPTSEDVHLYSEPHTAYTNEPIFLADCEGLEGGERDPMSTKLRRKRLGKKSVHLESSAHQARAARIVSERQLAWADSKTSNSREYAVTNLYPRLLYTFSDCVVFVLRNPKVIEGVLTKLVDWADAALETSSNQPVLPHALIVLNASESSADEDWWDVKASTRKIFRDLSRTVDKNPIFAKYKQKWQERGRDIRTVENMMDIYYSSINVIRIPTEVRPKIVQQQVNKLYDHIRRACDQSTWRKRELRMLLDADDMQSYLQHAFTHFARTLDAPFDFVQASFLNSPIPLDFGGNILKLAIDIMNIWENNADAETIFEELSCMVASCIMFDCARKKIVGTPSKTFPQYLEHLDEALSNFAQSHWPCEFIQPRGGGRCVNVRNGHIKGHQLKNGQLLAIGDYESRFSSDDSFDAFLENVYLRLEELHSELQARLLQTGQQETNAAAEIHRDIVMPNFYRRAIRGGKFFSSQTACYCCLFEPPEHVLPCGHILCTSCVRIYGRPSGNNEYEIQDCPIESGSCIRYQSWKFRVHLTPKTAGMRVLTLDGGGVKGIAELEVLRLIEISMGGLLPIRSFFDLIVGTSAGGLIALGLGVQHLSIQDCIDSFLSLCHKAFTRRPGSDVPLVGWFVENYNHSRYETKPLQDALQETFSSEQLLFGGPPPKDSHSPSIKVAVTSTSAASGIPVVFSNYNRPFPEKPSYHFVRPERSLNELRVWEAARATSAAPGFFKPFYHERSKATYMDGGICHNNPIVIAEKERKLVGGKFGDLLPDLVLSIGTGTTPRPRQDDDPNVSAPSLGVMNHLKHKIKIAKDHIRSALDCEQTWDNFLERVPREQHARYVRINPRLSMQTPKLDDLGSLRVLQIAVQAQMPNDPSILYVANKLISSCFYFELAGSQSDCPETCALPGRIACRLSDETKDIAQLGKVLKSKSQPGHELRFVIQEEGQSLNTAQEIAISNEVLDGMIRRHHFTLPAVRIRPVNNLAPTVISLNLGGDCYPISGFPRVLAEDSGIQSSMSSEKSLTKHVELTRDQIYGERHPLVTTVGKDVLKAHRDYSVIGSRPKERTSPTPGI